MKDSIKKYAALDALLTSAYIGIISSLLFYGSRFPKFPKEDTVLAPVIMLSLLVFSVAMVGSLIFGRPILWYLDGKKREAVLLLAYTLAAFFFLIAGFVSALLFL